MLIQIKQANQASEDGGAKKERARAQSETNDKHVNLRAGGKRCAMLVWLATTKSTRHKHSWRVRGANTREKINLNWHAIRADEM